MAQFDMNNFVNFLKNKKGGSSASGEERESLPKLRYYKTELGESYIRLLPYVSDDGMPAFCVWFYDNQSVFGERRSIAPFQFGLEDPIAEYVESRRKQGRLKEEEFKQVMKLTPRPSWFVPIAIRGREDEGAFLWELNDPKFKEFALATIASPLYQEESIIDPITGKDILINTVRGDKLWQGKPTKKWTGTVVPKQTRLAKTDAGIEKIISSIQDPIAYNKQFMRKTEYYQNLLTTALAFFQNGENHESADGNGIARGGKTAPKAGTGSRDEVESMLDDAFEDSDDDVF